MPAIVRRDDVEAGSDAHSDEADERIAKRRAIDVDRRPIRRSAGAGRRGRAWYRLQDLVAGRDRPRFDLRRRRRPEFDRRLERGDEHASEETGRRRSAASSPAPCAVVDGSANRPRRRPRVGDGEVVEAQGDAPPPALVGLPEELGVGDAGRQRIGGASAESSASAKICRSAGRVAMMFAFGIAPASGGQRRAPAELGSGRGTLRN